MREFTRRTAIIAVLGAGTWATGALSQPKEAPTPLPDFTPLAQPSATATPARGRVALIVANGAYRAETLANPGVDADMVSASLEKVGFSVTVKKDVAIKGFENAINDFAKTARGADVALFYFVGYGFSIAQGGRQQNLLMATDADFEVKTAFGLRSGGVAVEDVEETIIGYARATLMFIDASRNAPTMVARMVASGGNEPRSFAPVDPSKFEGAFVVLSTREGEMASDGVEGQGSPFARAVAAVLPTPRMRIEDGYFRIREKVRANTAGQQVPDIIRNDLPEGGLVLAPGDVH